MTGTARSSNGLAPHRKRVLFRAWHRGTREMDLILGRFADAHLRGLSEAELSDLEGLLEVPDRDVFDWITDAQPTPANYDTELFRSLKSFHREPA